MKDRKSLLMLMISGAVVVLFIIIMIIISAISGKRLSFEKLEDKLQSSAIKYYNSRPEELPKANNETSVVTADTLTGQKYMKAINKLAPKGSNCSGKVIVTKNGDDYLYSPILECGNDYSSKKLVSLLTDNVVSSGPGLYANENGYVFKGENVNNVVKLGDSIWAIIDIDANGYMRMINLKSRSKIRTIWDDRYNKVEKAYNGINDYSVSRIRDIIVDYANGDHYLKNEYKVYGARKEWCIGKRSESNIAINNQEECIEKSDEQLFGLPYVSDAFVASLDSDCHTINDESCNNYNYLGGYALASWTMTGVSESTSNAYYIVSGASISTKASVIRNIMPTMYLSNNVMYAEGAGSIEEPYILK